MKILRHLLMRLRRDRLDDELREEMAEHVELRTAELVEQGLPPAEARAAALRRFGNPTLIREESRTMWGFLASISTHRTVLGGSSSLVPSASTLPMR